jgi:EmrB/QacA subfamily drug resistance transporter
MSPTAAPIDEDASGVSPQRGRERRRPNRWAVLVLLGFAQLMVTLDVTIVNVALPSAQQTLHFSTDQRQWAITAYSLAFGSLLLLGGKLGDLFGRKWTFIGGLVGFAVASAIGGLAGSFGMLVAARGLQGAFGALLAPSALSLLTVSFHGSPARNKAFGIFSAIAASGASVGLVLGGVLTQALSWRWCLYVNLLIAVPLATASFRLLRNERRLDRPRIDVAGVALASTGFFAVVYGFSNAETDAWSAPITIAALSASVVLLAAFVVVEKRVRHPLLPLHIVRDRARGGAYASMAIVGCGIFAIFLFLTFYMQQNLGFTPLQSGLGFLPMTLAVVITAPTVQTRVLPRTGAKPVILGGLTLGIVAMLSFTRLSSDGSYAGQVLPGLILAGIGLASVFASSISTATLGVGRTDAGVASAMVNTSQQIGGSIGTALLSTIFAGATAAYISNHPSAAGRAGAASLHGYTTGFAWAAAIFGLGLLVALAILPFDGVARARSAQAQALGELDSASTPA